MRVMAAGAATVAIRQTLVAALVRAGLSVAAASTAPTVQVWQALVATLRRVFGWRTQWRHL